ncbi:metallophosphoesterase family protein [Oceanobacillus neutriphilus]|uniref:Calcineurin-like phosphoesterase domain-containing protein n=1 Tax=Oceanobacillus neutriphilus TaxID=531815 RepID=A0ABQ2NVR9_9BACI|nr:metallophosphoesterase family protein [Oceanobacillus neutriphilus]GGP11822.1 hypothetical protein GCM10011346_25360 [Oceanobacillus neutriphilus]
MYRIAIITDIHGNISALNAVLKDIKEQSIDYIYCLGDMIGIGPFSNEVLETLFDLENISMITGNHDESVLALLNNHPYPKSRVNVIPHQAWIAERLKKEYKEKLESLPRIINPTYYEKQLHLTHYPMTPVACDSPICEDPFDIAGIPSKENFSSINSLSEFSLVCFGHDHHSHQIECNSTLFFNPGSLGVYNKSYAHVMQLLI